MATGVTGDLPAGQPQNTRYTHAQFIFTQSGWLAPHDLKKLEAKLQRTVQVMRPLQMASVEGSAEHSAESLPEDCQLGGIRKIPASW